MVPKNFKKDAETEIQLSNALNALKTKDFTSVKAAAQSFQVPDRTPQHRRN
jgi:hypothetical protein